MVLDVHWLGAGGSWSFHLAEAAGYSSVLSTLETLLQPVRRLARSVPFYILAAVTAGVVLIVVRPFQKESAGFNAGLLFFGLTIAFGIIGFLTGAALDQMVVCLLLAALLAVGAYRGTKQGPGINPKIWR